MIFLDTPASRDIWIGRDKREGGMMKVLLVDDEGDILSETSARYLREIERESNRGSVGEYILGWITQAERMGYKAD